MIQYVDLIIKILALIAIITGVLQLIETRKRRMVDMYWKIAEIQSSEKITESRHILNQIPEEIPSLKKLLELQQTDEELKNQVIEEYQKQFHDAVDDTKEKQMDKKARIRDQFLNQVGVLVRKNLIDKDLLFALIGGGLEIEYPIIILIEGHRKAHNYPKLYKEVDFLFSTYINWKNE